MAQDPDREAELSQLRDVLAVFAAASGRTAEQLAETEDQLRQALEEQREWEELAAAAEGDKAALRARLAELQAAAQRQGATALASLRQASRKAAGQLNLDEAATRELIDEQLRQAGWEADSQRLRYSLGTRPEKHRNLAIAWRETTNQEMTASIMGFIRQAALGDPLVPYEHRVERALGRSLASQSWTKPQRDWLVRIANQTKALAIVDREALDDDALFFKREGGGWLRLNRLFGGELEGVLRQFQREVWAA